MLLNVRGFLLASSAIALPAAASEPALPATEQPPVLTAPYDPLSPEVQKEALAWVSRNAQPLAVPTQDLCVDPLLAPETLKPMTEALAKPRVIGIGELSHGDCESFAYKASLIRALILYNGVTVIGMEASIEGGRQLDAFIAPGQPTLSGDALVAAANKALRAANVFDLWKTPALRDLLVWLRVHNQTAAKPVHFANFDVQSPFADSQFAVRFLTSALVGPAFRTARYNAIRLKLAGIAKTLSPLLTVPTTADRFDGYLIKQKRADFESHRAAADQLFQLFAEAPATLKNMPDFWVAEQSAFAFSNWMEASTSRVGQTREEVLADMRDGTFPVSLFSVRDRGMADSVFRVLRQHPTSRMALWAHNRHVGRSGFQYADVKALSMGQNLNAKLGDNYAVVSFTAYQGSYNPIVIVDEKGKAMPADTFPLPPNPYTLGGLYAKLNQQSFWLDMRKLPNSIPWELAWRNYPYILQEGGFGPTKAEIYSTSIVPVGFDHDINVFFNTVRPTVWLDPPKAAP